MNKVELQAKADALTEEINFLRALYEAVSTTTHLPPAALNSSPQEMLNSSLFRIVQIMICSLSQIGRAHV